MTSPFKNRLTREREIEHLGLSTRTKNYLSGNYKTGFSLNFPIKNCQPTKTCSQYCYACTSGPIMFRASLQKALDIEYTLEHDLELAVSETVKEITRHKLNNLRYSGGGELSTNGIKYLYRLAEELPNVIFWGFTRKIRVAKALHNSKKNIKIIFSLDSDTPHNIAKSVKSLGYKTSWLYVHKTDTQPKGVFVSFPNHAHGRLDKTLPSVKNECPAIRDHSRTCEVCRKCINLN